MGLAAASDNSHILPKLIRAILMGDELRLAKRYATEAESLLLASGRSQTTGLNISRSGLAGRAPV